MGTKIKKKRREDTLDTNFQILIRNLATNKKKKKERYLGRYAVARIGRSIRSFSSSFGSKVSRMVSKRIKVKEKEGEEEAWSFPRSPQSPDP